MNAELLTCSESDLRAAGKATAAQQPDRHWANLAVVLGRTEDERHYQTWKYASTRVYAEDELGVPPRDYITLMELWRLMQQALGSVSLEEWRKLSKAKALLVRKVAALGGSVKDWVAKAQQAKTASILRKAVDKAMGADTSEWVVFKVPMPKDLEELCEAALVIAIPDALPDEAHPDKARAQDRDARFRCLEVILTDWVQRHAVTTSGPETAGHKEDTVDDL